MIIIVLIEITSPSSYLTSELLLTFRKGLIHYFLAEGIGRFIPLVLLPYIAVQLSPGEFGTFSLFQLYLSLGTLLVLVGTDQGIFRFYPEAEDGEKGKWLNTGLIIVLLSGTVLLIIGGLLGKLLTDFLFAENIPLAWYHLPVLITLYAINSQYLTSLKAGKKSFFFMTAFIFRQFIFYAVFVVGIWYQLSIFSFVYAYYASEIILLTLLIFGISPDPHLPEKPYFSDLLKFSFPMMSVIVFGLLIYQADHYLIKFFLGIEKVGEYNFSYRFAAALGTLVILINHVWLPRVYEKGKHYFSQTLKITMTFALLLQAISFLILYQLMRLLLGTPLLPEEFVISDIFPILGFAYLFYGSLQQLDVILLMDRRSTLLGIYYLVTFLINVAGNIVVIPAYGIVGASVVTLFSFVILWIILLSHYLWDKDLRRMITPFLTVFILMICTTATAIFFDLQLYAILLLILCTPVFFKMAGAGINYGALFKGNFDAIIKLDRK